MITCHGEELENGKVDIWAGWYAFMMTWRKPETKEWVKQETTSAYSQLKCIEKRKTVKSCVQTNCICNHQKKTFFHASYNKERKKQEWGETNLQHKCQNIVSSNAITIPPIENWSSFTTRKAQVSSTGQTECCQNISLREHEYISRNCGMHLAMWLGSVYAYRCRTSLWNTRMNSFLK